MKSRLHLIILTFTLFTSIVTHWEIFNKDLIGVHLWRQIQNQWNIRNFYREDNNILNPRIAAHNLGHEGNILRYEFPLMQWSIAQIQRLFGESIIVTRISMVIIGSFGIAGFYVLIHLLFRDRILAAAGAWMLNFSPLFYYYSMNPMSDIPAMACQIWMLVFALKFYQNQKSGSLIWSALFFCLAGLFKLPYALFGVVPLSAAGLIFWQRRSLVFLFQSILILIIFSLPVMAWYTYAIRSWQSMGVLQGIFAMEDKTPLWHFFRFHLLNWLPVYLINPAAFVFFIVGLIALVRKRLKISGLHILLVSGALAGLVYYIYELNMISTVHDYYMLPFLPGLYLLVVYGLHRTPVKMVYIPVTVFLLLSMPVLAYNKINVNFYHIDRNGYNPDWFLYNDSLKQAVPQDSLCIFLNDNTGVVMPYEVDKQGFVFDQDDLPLPWIEDMIINRGVKYMYSDSRKIDSSQAIQSYLDTLILRQGSVKVFRLAKPEIR